MLIEEGGTSQHNPRPWNKACRRLIWHTNSNSFSDTPLHIAATKGNIDIAKFLVQGYESAIRDEAAQWDVAEAHPSNDQLGVIPFNIENSQKEIPLFVALKKKHDDLGVYLLSVTIFNVAHLRDEEGKNAYEIAVENGCEKSRISISDISVRISAEDLLSWGPYVKNILHPSVLKIVHHFASGDAEMSEMLRSKSVRSLAMEGLSMFVREPKKDANTHLKEAAERGADWLVKLLLEGDNTLINDSTPAWQIACTNGHLSTLCTFVEECYQQEIIKLCQNDKETPLHHINKVKYGDYKNLLANPTMQALKNQLDSDGATPLHQTIERNDIGLTKALLETEGIQLNIEDRNHRTALDLLEARCVTNDTFLELYKEMLANPVMTQELISRVDSNGATPLHRAIVQNAQELAKALMETKGIKLEIKDNNGITAFDLIEERCSTRPADVYWYELYAKLLAIPERLQKMKNGGDSSGATALLIAIEWDDLKLAKTLLHAKGIELSIRNRNGKTGLDLIEERCDQNDSLCYELYKVLFDNPMNLHELKNRQAGFNKYTPLHRAIKWDDTNLTRTLLETNGIEVDIEDSNGYTVLDLLEKHRYSRKWYEMCQELKLDPSSKVFRLKYLQRRTSLKDMSSTLSVVAALLATITFAAGFTVPGGVDEDGTATLGTKAVFLVFFIANTIAMCSSMVVLFMMIGIMIWEAHPKAVPLIDLCVSLLQLSLCGTIVAFMTGVYAIMAPKVQWAAIVVIILCSLAFVGALLVLPFSGPSFTSPSS